MTHEITLNHYTAIPAGLRSSLNLGTRDSYGNEQLSLHLGAEWEGLAVTVTFHPPGGGEPVRMLADAAGQVIVPPEATAAAGEGQMVFAGLAEGVQRISCDLPYRVEEHAGMEGAESTATPTVWEQAVTAAAQSALEAQGSAADAAASAETAVQSAQSTAGAANSAQQAAETAQSSAAAATEAAVAAQASEDAAAQSQTASAASADAAAQRAQEAAENATDLAEAVNSAAQSAAAAALSETAAQSSAAAAAESVAESAEIQELMAETTKTMGQWVEQAGQIMEQTRANASAAAISKDVAEESAEQASGYSTSASLSAAQAQQAADLAQQAALNPPQMSESLTWQVWSQTEGRYLDTGVSAVGPQGAQGPKGDSGNGIQLMGNYESYEQMIAAQPTPSQGDACTVNGQLWVFTDGTWENAGQLQGVKGDTGPAGEDGHTPVKGVDYWTEADIAQMVQQTLEALPVYAGEIEEVAEDE